MQSSTKNIALSLCAFTAALTFAAQAGATTSAELYQTQAEVYGRFEARMRFAAGDGVVSSFFLWKSGSEMTGAYWNELDFEKVGADCHLQTNAIFGAPSVQHSAVNKLSADLCGAYHTYTFEWTPTYISYQVDGMEIRRETGATAQAFAQNASAGMQMHFNVWPGDASFGGNFDPAILPVHQYISWVRYSSYANGNFTVVATESFDASTVPSGWVTGNWASPKGYSTHSPANVNFLNGIAVLSLTNDNATGFTGTPPADTAAGGSDATGAGGSATSQGGSSAGGSSAGGSSAFGGTSSGQAGAGESGGNATGSGDWLTTTAGGTSSTTSTGGSSSTSTGGGAATSTGGSAPSAGGTAVAGSSQAGASAGGTDSGCSCRLLPTRSDTQSGAAWMGLTAVAALVGRRRRAR